MSMFVDTSFLLIIVALVATVAFLVWKERLHRPMWIVKSAVFAVLLMMLGDTLSQAVGIGAIVGLLWEILNELSSRRAPQ